MKPTQAQIEADVARWLAEDVGTGDVTSESTIPEGARGLARMRTKQALVVCGLAWAREAFRQVEPRVRFRALAKDGDRVEKGTVFAEVRGPVRALLTAERTALNICQHLSGIATLTARFADAVTGTRARILDTRKTTPGLRLAEKYAVACGGGVNHRIGLFDLVLVKDNHVKAAGGIAEAVAAVRARGIAPRRIEVEVQTLAELREALTAGAGMILLDNMPPRTMREAVAIADGRALLEASGGVDLRRVRRIAETGVDRISVGALTHSAPAVDIHMKLAD